MTAPRSIRPPVAGRAIASRRSALPEGAAPGPRRGALAALLAPAGGCLLLAVDRVQQALTRPVDVASKLASSLVVAAPAGLVELRAQPALTLGASLVQHCPGLFEQVLPGTTV